MSRSPDANPVSLLSLSIRREGEACNNVLPDRRQRDRSRIGSSLWCSARDRCLIFALQWEGTKLVRQSDWLPTKEKWTALFHNWTTTSKFIILKFKTSYMDRIFQKWNTFQFSIQFWNKAKKISSLLYWPLSLVGRISARQIAMNYHLWTYALYKLVSDVPKCISKFRWKSIKNLKFVVYLKGRSKLPHANCSVQITKTYGI